MISIRLAPGCTTAPMVVTFNLLTMPCTGALQIGAPHAVLRGFDVFIEDGQIALRLGEILVGLRSKRGERVGDFRLGLRELPAHFGRLAVEPQHLDLGHNLLFVESAGEGEFPIEQFEGAAEPRDLLVQHVDILRQLLRAQS